MKGLPLPLEQSRDWALVCSLTASTPKEVLSALMKIKLL
jgi:hypothetical protein